MSEEKLPGWIRFLDILVGLIVLILGAVVLYGLFVPGVLIESWIIWIFGIILILYGIYQLIKSFVHRGWTLGTRVLHFLLGILLIVFGGMAFTYSLLVLAVIVIFFGISVIILGIILIVDGFADSELKGWVRGLAVIAGFILLIAGIIFIFYWATAGAVWWLIVLALGLMIEGIVRLIVGITGESY